MQQPYPYSGFASFHDSSSMPAYTSAQSHYYNHPDFASDGRKDHSRFYQQRGPSSGSVSPSLPQSLEHPSSTLSTTSGASGQSTASSTVGSPYSLAAHSLPGQDTWADLNQGLGIAPDIIHNDGFPQHGFPNGGLENELCFHDGKFPDSFVGESPKVSSSSSLQYPPITRDFDSSGYVSPSPYCAALLSSFGEMASIPIPSHSPPCIPQPYGLPADGERDERPKSPSSNADTISPSKGGFRQPANPASASAQQHAAYSSQNRCYRAGKSIPRLSNGNFVEPLSSSYPSLIQPFDTPLSHNTTSALYPSMVHAFPLPSQTFQPPSPSPSDTSSYDSHRSGSGRFRSGTASPYLHSSSFQPYPRGSEARRLSIASSLSRVSQENTRSTSLSLDEDGKERGRCPNPDCGRLFKDLKAHMLTHQSERPEKCPIMTCEYHQKGFARKYDKNRHTLTHYKGTMVCGFCPGSGSAAEKSFNRADVFKRHLTSLHGVEQTPPNSRKKSPTASGAKKTSDYSSEAAGKCSTCSAMFSNAQEFYEHLDDCVLRVVQQEEPSEAINEQHLTKVANDQSVLETLDRNMVNGAKQKSFPADEDDERSESEEFKDEASSDWPRSTRSNARSGKAGRGGPGVKMQGMTLSRGGVPLVGKGRKKRKHYPVSWGCSADKMKMKKRVLCVYDGPRRLWKDDMMLDSEFEVRMRLGDSGAYVTDLDVNTLKRSEALHGATDEEKGPWVPEEDSADIQQLMAR
ncbi:MAG: hypothetical protein Q9168_004559 [Polycauliona sp. 1 TL-2023]